MRGATRNGVSGSAGAERSSATGISPVSREPPATNLVTDAYTSPGRPAAGATPGLARGLSPTMNLPCSGTSITLPSL